MKAIKKSFVFIPLLITVMLIVIAIAVLTAGQPNEIKIYTGAEFIRFVETAAATPGKRAVLYADIKVSEEYEPISLACELDGNGYTLTVKDTGIPSLFSRITETGRVKNLILAGKEGSTDIDVTAGIAAENLGTIENCKVCADFAGGKSVNGICHINGGVISNCLVLSYESGNRSSQYTWDPICKENSGSVTDCYYSDESLGKYDTVGAYISSKEIQSEKLLNALKEYSKKDTGLAGWVNDEKGYPALTPEDSSTAASAFSGGNGVFIVCIIILIIAVPIFTIVYADKQKKKVFYDKA